MKAGAFIKKNKLLFLVGVLYVVLFIIVPKTAIQSFSNSIYYLVEMLQVLPVIFLFTVVLEALVPKELIMRGFGDESGIKGNLLSLLLGSISAGPVYAAFPICKTLLRKGANITNIIIILSSWAVIKVPMLANEAKFLGVNFMIVRWILTVVAIYAMAHITSAIVKKRDLPVDEASVKTSGLEINKDYCIGCRLCVNQLPQYYEMKENKASVRAGTSDYDNVEAIVQSVHNCPTQAIVFKSEKGEVA